MTGNAPSGALPVAGGNLPPATPEPRRPSLARNALNLVLGQAVTLVLGVFFSALLGRTLGAEDFGLYFLISTFAAFAGVLVDWGQQFFGIREVARSPERGGEILGTGLVLRTVGTLLACIPTGLLAWALGYDRRTIGFTVAFLALNLPLFLTQAFGIVFRGTDRMGLDAAVSVVNRAAVLLLALLALRAGLGLSGVVVAQGAAGLVALAIAFGLYRRVSGRPLRFSAGTVREVLAGGTAILTMTLMANVQPYIDAVVLSELVPKDAIGWYGAAKNIMGSLLAPSLILGTAAFPRLSRAASDLPRFREEMLAAQRPMFWLGGLASVGTCFFGDVAIAVVYGQRNFGPAGSILSVFGLALFLLFVDVLLGTALTALGKSTAFSMVKVVSVVLATGLELLLIPWFQARNGNGGLGVVVSFVISELLVFASLLVLIPRGTLGPAFALDLARALVSAVATGAALLLLPRLGPWLEIPLCILLFAVVSMAVGLLRRTDLRQLRLFVDRRAGRSGPTSALGSRGRPAS